MTKSPNTPPISVRILDAGERGQELMVPAEISDVKAVVAAVHFIVNNAAKYDVPPETLETELQQLGLPKGMPRSRSRWVQC